MGSVSVIFFSFAALGVRASPMNYKPMDIDTETIGIDLPTLFSASSQTPTSSTDAVSVPVSSALISSLPVFSDGPTDIASGTSVSPTPESSLVSSLLPASPTSDFLSTPTASPVDISSLLSIFLETPSAVQSPILSSAMLSGFASYPSQGVGDDGNQGGSRYLQVGQTRVWGRDIASFATDTSYTGTVAAESVTVDSQYYPQTTGPSYATPSLDSPPQTTDLLIETTSFDEPQTTSYDESQTTSYDEPQTTSFDEPQTTSYDEPQTTSYDQPQTTSFDEPQMTDPSYDTTSFGELPLLPVL